MPDTITPDWPAPPRVRALVTTRSGGVSHAPFRSLNLGAHVGDDAAAVAENRRRLAQEHRLPAEPFWIRQVHGHRVVDVGHSGPEPKADGAVSFAPGRVCAILSADCLPLLLCARDGTAVGAAHAGWRGLMEGVVEQTLKRLGRGPRELMAWLGPAISANAYEVGDEVRAAFVGADPDARAAFSPNPQGRWQADLYALARLRLANLGVECVFGGDHCTYTEPERFYSYRRDGRTGRMVSLIWLQD